MGPGPPRGRVGGAGLENSAVVAVAIAAAAVAPHPPRMGVFWGNGFFTIGPQNRDLGALLPGNDSYGRPAFVVFMKC